MSRSVLEASAGPLGQCSPSPWEAAGHTSSSVLCPRAHLWCAVCLAHQWANRLKTVRCMLSDPGKQFQAAVRDPCPPPLTENPINPRSLRLIWTYSTKHFWVFMSITKKREQDTLILYSRLHKAYANIKPLWTQNKYHVVPIKTIKIWFFGD